MSRQYQFPDPWILISIIGLVGVGLISNYSTSFAEGELEFAHFYRQLLWATIGGGLMLLTVAIPIRVYQSFAYFFYIIGVLALVGVMAFGHVEMGARRWIDLGAFRLQPSEFAKLTTLLGVARFLTDFPRDRGKAWVTLVAIAMCVVPMGLILVEPDMGTSLVFPMMMFCLLAWAGIPFWHLVLLLTPVLAVLTSWHQTLHMITLAVIVVSIFLNRRRLIPIALAIVVFLSVGSATPHLWSKLHPYQQKRLLTFINPEADPLGSAYQIIQSKIALGSGGITGKGFLHGTQTQLKFLPEGHTDFIFSAFGEEFGFAGTLVVALLFFILFVRSMQFAQRCHNPFYSLITAGGACLIVAQVLTNLMMTVGFLPVTGIPLPFVSYGGSSLLNMLALSGLIISVSIRWREY
jgi:rod shape determining protein RodA